MADRPIIFSGPMVRALLAGRKTQTRRVLPPNLQVQFDMSGEAILRRHPRQRGIGWDAVKRLWVREACGRRPASFLGMEATNGVESAFYKADDEDVLEARGFNLCPWWKGKASSPMLMPRLVSRLTLIVTDVRVQRLQDISQEDAEAEGIRKMRDGSGAFVGREGPGRMVTPWLTASEAFADTWDSLHGADAWDANPWVAALTFTVHRGNIDTMLGAERETVHAC